MKKFLALLFACVLVLQPCMVLGNTSSFEKSRFDHEIASPMGEIPPNYIKWTPEIGKEDEKLVQSRLNELLNDVPKELQDKYFSELISLSHGYLLVTRQGQDGVPEIQLNRPQNILYSSQASKDLGIEKANYDINTTESILKTVKEKSSIKDKVYIDRLNTVTLYSTIQAIFRAHRLPISYHFYNHYIGKSGTNLYFDLTGHKADLINRYDGVGIESNIKQGLYNANFHTFVDNEMGSRGYGESNKDGFHYQFSYNSDLGLAIHGTTNILLHRTAYQKTYFRIYDIYDFNTADRILTEFDQNIFNPEKAGTDYRVIIEGLQIGKIIQ